MRKISPLFLGTSWICDLFTVNKPRIPSLPKNNPYVSFSDANERDAGKFKNSETTERFRRKKESRNCSPCLSRAGNYEAQGDHQSNKNVVCWCCPWVACLQKEKAYSQTFCFSEYCRETLSSVLHNLMTHADDVIRLLKCVSVAFKECVRSCDQKAYLHNETKGWICIKIEFNSRKNISLLQHGRRSFVYSSNMVPVTSCEHTLWVWRN